MYIICNIFWILEYFFVSEIFLCALSFAWCKVQHAPVTLLLHGILMALLIWLRVWVLWEAASYILDSFLFCTEHVDWVWISCLPCGWCIEVQCLIWVQFSSALLNWQETWLFWWGRKGGGSVFCWLCMLKWLRLVPGWHRKMKREVSLWHLAVRSACFAALPQSEQFERSSNLLVRVQVLV